MGVFAKTFQSLTPFGLFLDDSKKKLTTMADVDKIVAAITGDDGNGPELSKLKNFDEAGEAVENAAESLLEAFIFLDKNHDQKIAAVELDSLLEAMGFEGISEDDRQQIINIFDDNDNGEMDLLEFCEFFAYVFRLLVKRRPKSKYLKYLWQERQKKKAH